MARSGGDRERGLDFGVDTSHRAMAELCGIAKSDGYFNNVVPLVYWIGQVMLPTDRYQNGPV